MTEDEKRMEDRQALDFEPEVLEEPIGGPVPEWNPKEPQK